MAKKSYAMHVAMILGSSTALLVFMFILVAHHRSIPEKVRMDRSTLLASGSSVAERIKPVGEVAFATAQTGQPPAKNAVAAATPDRDGQQVYQASCVACHDAGIAGAPKLGDKGQWAKRIAKGLDALYASAVNGVQGSAGVMPAKGGNPALSDAEVRAAVDYMMGRSR
ncbi:MAG: c-type cytochrome [Burkholderiales bacterium]